ncbi:MAG: DNA helicase RecQ [Eubacteriales bacterium]
MDKYELLKTYFGHSAFRDGQEKIVDNLTSGIDALCVMPTGAGKSVCYQIPALLAEGITLVISPLISLMKDQVGSLVQNGVKAAYINSSLTPPQYCKVIERANTGLYKIIYVAPERLLVNDFINFCLHVKISLIAVDEAHCVSQWGQDFRPSYLKIVEFINKLPYRPVIGAFTATATKEVEDDIIKILKLKKPLIISTGFDRKNLFFDVRHPKKKLDELLQLMREYKGKAGIIYCSTRKHVEDVCDALNLANYSATRYHAGLSDEERYKNQDDFIYDRKQIIVATNAFGMGIDKSNVSFVIHFNMPKNIESYYQEAGRAGRDGETADCILFFSAGDVQTNLFFIEKSEDNSDLDPRTRELVKTKDRERLKQMTNYCKTTECLRANILNYFGEKSGTYCGNCSSCLTEFTEADITEEAYKIIFCIAGTGQRYGIKIISEVLRGIKNEKTNLTGLDKHKTFGIMANADEKKLRSVIDYLLSGGYIKTTNSEYPVLALTDKSDLVLKKSEVLLMKQHNTTVQIKSAAGGNKVHITGATSPELLIKLKELRKKIAAEEKVPAYIVFTDASLRDMCEKKPTTLKALLDVSGIGQIKQQKYGSRFIDLICDHISHKNT